MGDKEDLYDPLHDPRLRYARPSTKEWKEYRRLMRDDLGW